MVMATFVVATLQARGVVSLKPIMPEFSRINPVENAKNLLGMRQIVELLKSLGKLAIVGSAVYSSIKAALPDAITLSQQTQIGFLFVVKRYTVRMLASAGGAYLVLAAGDYIWQWWRHEKSLRMTKEEVKLEMKQNDGDPQIKQRRRAIAASYARRQMMKDVPNADVVIVNPTHIAIAIKYDRRSRPAPIVLAIGQRKVAERIKAIARESGVPTIENKPLASRVAQDGESRHAHPVRALHGRRRSAGLRAQDNAVRAVAGRGARSHERIHLSAGRSRTRAGATRGGPRARRAVHHRAADGAIAGHSAGPVPGDEHRYVDRRAARVPL
jgi:flagellar biosynthesis protein FlhB